MLVQDARGLGARPAGVTAMDAQAVAAPAVPAVPAARARPWAPLVVGAMTLALTLYLSFQSSELHTVERVRREHEAFAGEQPRQ